MGKRSILILGAYTFISFMIAGCGGNEVLMKPNYANKLVVSNQIADSRVKVVNVIDRRNTDSTTVGTGRVGLFEREVPYRLSVPLNVFVRGVLDSLLMPSSPDSTSPAIVYIDSFEVSAPQGLFTETARVEVRMDFGIPVNADSILYIATRANEAVETFSQATPFLEPLIYKGVVDCGTQFVATIRKLDIKPSGIGSDTLPRMLATVPANIPLATIEGVPQAPAPTVYHDVGLGYSTGGKVTSEIRLFGDIMAQKDSSNTMTGFGLNLDVLSITNKSSDIKGALVVFGGNFKLRQFFTDSTSSPYLGFEGTLIFGNENIRYSDHQETSFFFGPMLRETFGISIEKKLFLDAGLYECALIGSKMLPSDFGFTFGMSFGV